MNTCMLYNVHTYIQMMDKLVPMDLRTIERYVWLFLNCQKQPTQFMIQLNHSIWKYKAEENTQ